MPREYRQTLPPEERNNECKHCGTKYAYGYYGYCSKACYRYDSE